MNSDDAPLRAPDPTVRIAPDVRLGANPKLGPYINLYGCHIGNDCVIGAFVEIQRGVTIGDRCKVSSHSFLCEGVQVADEVFIGHGVRFTNDRLPRATTPDGKLKGSDDWNCEPTFVRRRASIGSGAVILCGLTLGEESMVAAGTVVTKDVPAGMLVIGNPGKIVGPAPDH